MYEEVTFKAEIASLLPSGFNTDAHRNACWQVYNNAQAPDHNRLVAGRLEHLGDEQIRILGKTNASSSGSILRTENTWSIILNDSWILGGVHGHVNFELVSPVRGNVMDQNYTTDLSADRKFTVTGRELIGLKTFGYQQVYGPVEKISHDSRPADLPGTNILLQCTNPQLADAATLTRYTNEVMKMAASGGATKAAGWQILDDMFI